MQRKLLIFFREHGVVC